jgi:hypothetical protein
MATSATGRLSSDGQALERLTVAPRNNTPRLLTEGDCGWMLALAKRRYSNHFDFQATEMWYRNLVLKGPMLFYPMRTDNAFCISMLSTTPWNPSTPEANVVLVCADENCVWEAVTLLRASIAWAKNRKCSLWRVSSETHFDLGAIAHKLGAKEPQVRWVMRLE